MDQKAFVDLLRSVVLDRLSIEIANDWQYPAGRLRSEERSRRTEWMNSLSRHDREFLEAFGQHVARSAVFGVLCVLDGVRKIEDSEDGHIELRHITNSQSQLLASSGDNMPAEFLHEMLP